MKLNFVTDRRIASDAIIQVIAHPTVAGLYGAYDTEFNCVEFDGELEEVIRFAVHANDVLSGLADLFN